MHLECNIYIVIFYHMKDLTMTTHEIIFDYLNGYIGILV